MEDRQQRNDRKAQPMSNPMADAIAAKFEQQAEANAARAPFEPDPELERIAERMEIMRQTSPQQYADANFGGLRTRVTNYLARKAEHERNNR